MTRYTELCFVCVGVGNTELCLLVVLDWVTLLPSEIADSVGQLLGRAGCERETVLWK